MQIWYDECWTATGQVNTRLSAWADEILYYLKVEFVVTHGNANKQVNLLTKSCSYREFDLDHMQCQYGMVICCKYKISWYEMCSFYYYYDTLRMTCA